MPNVGIAIVTIWVSACGGGPTAMRPSICGDRQPVVNASIGGGLRYSEYCVPEEPDSLTAGPDGAVWFMENDGSVAPVEKVGRLTSDGVLREYSIAGDTWYGGLPNHFGSGITRGPDGALWFIGFNKQKHIVGRITTSGAVSTYGSADPNFIHQPTAITPGPDGELWFSALNGELGRVTTAGVVTVFQCVTCLGHSSLSIASGPDGALWFTSYGEILRMSTSGAIDLHRMAPPNIWGTSITEGPDRAMWFTQYANAVGRITVSGVLTDFAVPPESDITRGVPPYPTAITAGSDGSLWFSEPDRKIGRISTSGVVTEYAIPGLPTQIVGGSDHSVWFLESGKKIARVSFG